jgi:ribulose-phosphate 3-epimerase
MTQIWPSLLAADLLNLESQIKLLTDQGITSLHLDIMDNHYVPNLSFSPELCQQIHQRFPLLEIDVHLMTTPVDALIKKFGASGAKRMAIHPNTTIHLNQSLKTIEELGCQAGLALNPAENIEALKWCHHQLDYVLVMTVNPGFGGQKLIPQVIEKIKQIRENYPKLRIMVDGGVDLTNITLLKDTGASDFVVGSALFKAQNFPHCIPQFLQMVQS